MIQGRRASIGGKREMEDLVMGDTVVLSIDTYGSENENAYNRILWVTCGVYCHGAEEAIHMNQDRGDEDKWWRASVREQAGRQGECKG